MNRSLEQSFKSQIRNLAAQSRISPVELWENLVLERFLVRVARSRFADYFILKGGMLLANYLDIRRHTQDLDFLVQSLPNSLNEIEQIVFEVISIPVEDGFDFHDLEVRELTHPHMTYTGVRAFVRAHFGKTRFKMAVDLGFGDIAQPVVHSLSLTSGSKGPFFEGHVRIKCYPKEFIFSEKLESIIYLGRRNSRMKDFHDLYLMTQEGNFEPTLESVIRSVFEHRGTVIDLPVDFTQDDWSELESLWAAHRLDVKRRIVLPERLKETVGAINEWLDRSTTLCKGV